MSRLQVRHLRARQRPRERSLQGEGEAGGVSCTCEAQASCTATSIPSERLKPHTICLAHQQLTGMCAAHSDAACLRVHYPPAYCCCVQTALIAGSGARMILRGSTIEFVICWIVVLKENQESLAGTDACDRSKLSCVCGMCSGLQAACGVPTALTPAPQLTTPTLTASPYQAPPSCAGAHPVSAELSHPSAPEVACSSRTPAVMARTS
jgi:hypothetical protein